MDFVVSVLAGSRAGWVALTAGVLLASASATGATPVGDALDRPALTSPFAAKAVLNGAAQAGGRLVAVGERGIVVVSRDGGARWRQVPCPVSVGLTAVRFADDKHGYAVGHGGTVLTTVDGGESWERRFDGRSAARIALATARAAGDMAALTEAERLVADGPDKPLLDLLVVDSEHAIVVGAYGLAFATADGGRTWTSLANRLENPKGLHLYAIRARGSRILVAGEQGLVRLSENGGESFKIVTTPYRGSFFTAEFTSDTEMVVAGLRGNVWRSVDLGRSWVQIPVSVPVSITASTVRENGDLVLVNQAGGLLSVRRDDVSLFNKQPLPPLNAVLDTRDGGLLVFGSQGPVAITVGGQK